MIRDSMEPSAAMEERELALVVLAPDWEAFARDIAGLETLGGYRLVPRAPLRLRDVYWDLPGGDLGARHIALRLRMAGGRTWVTLKGPSRPAGDAGVRRMEVERPWSQDGLREVLHLLDEGGFAFPERADLGSLDDRFRTMRGLGLQIVQDRETERTRRDIVDRQQPDAKILAELAIDATHYQTPDTVVTIRQIEIESKGPSGGTAIKAIAAALHQRYPNALQTWVYGKLATGMALAALIDAGVLRPLLRHDGSLDRSAYELLARYLDHESP